MRRGDQNSGRGNKSDAKRKQEQCEEKKGESGVRAKLETHFILNLGFLIF